MSRSASSRTWWPGVTGLKAGDAVGGNTLGVFADYAVVPAKKMSAHPPSVKEPKYCLPEPLGLRRQHHQGGHAEVRFHGRGHRLRDDGAAHRGGSGQERRARSHRHRLYDSRLEWAKQMGATTTINPKRESLTEKIHQLTGGQGVDTAIEITGRLAGLTAACDIIKTCRGEILIPSLYFGNQVLEAACGYQLMFKSPILHSTHPNYSPDRTENERLGIWAYAQGLLPLRPLITHEFKLAEIAKAFESLETGADGYVKGIVTSIAPFGPLGQKERCLMEHRSLIFWLCSQEWLIRKPYGNMEAPTPIPAPRVGKRRNERRRRVAGTPRAPGSIRHAAPAFRVTASS